MKRILHFALFGIISLALSACNLGRSSAPESLAALPAVTLSIQAQNPSGIFAAGQVINYQYTVSNVGGTALAGPLAVGGAKTPVNCPNLNTVGNRDNNLDPGESITCTGSYTLTQVDVTAGAVTNSATASIGGSISTQASSVVNAPVNKVLTLTKMANPTTYSQAGQTITFSYVITNSGGAQLGPAQFTVSDDHIPGPINCGAPDATLPPAGTVSCTAVYTITPTDAAAGSVTSSATASGPGVSTALPASTTLTFSGGGAPLPQPNPSGLARGSTIQYKVIKGEWMIQIARCFGADAAALARSNPQVLDPDEISPDEILTVPNIGSNGTIYGPPCITFHTVQSGDTWNSIAQKYNADVIVLQAANRLVSLTAGSSVRVPLNSAGGSPGTGATPIPTQNPTACNQAQMVADVTVPDGTTYAPGANFTKTWRLKNTGTCTWTSAYVMVFDHGTQMDAPATVPLTTVNVPPGSTVDVSAPLKAPATPGTYQADFRLRSPDNVLFGIGSTGQGSFWVKIVVAGVASGTLSAPQPTAITPGLTSTVSSDVVTLLGKKITGGPEILAFQAAYTDGPCAEITPGTGVLECKSKTGETPFVRLVASNPADLVNSTIRDVRVFPKYIGNLPEGLTWQTTRSAVEAKLGLPISDPLDNGNNTVDAEYKTASGAYRLWITFPSDEPAATATMRRLRIALPQT